VLIVLSVLASTRYLYWRLTETISFDTWLSGLFGSGLFLAELVRLDRADLWLFPDRLATWSASRYPWTRIRLRWPTVDVLIPTYNEPLKVVRTTVFAAMAMDWPKDKLRVYILDDGKREDFRQFVR
jgi:cellulose synthase (UDP-forming)